jgi:hypothetical protein
MLADLFDPNPDQFSRIKRKLVFKKRSRGSEKQDLATTVVALHVWKCVKRGCSVTKAIEDTVLHFKLDESTVKKLWGRYRPIFEATWGKLQ